MIQLFLKSPLREGRTYSLSVAYRGTLLHRDLNGFYLSSYQQRGDIRSHKHARTYRHAHRHAHTVTHRHAHTQRKCGHRENARKCKTS